MGMYTQLQGRIVVKNQAIDSINKMVEDYEKHLVSQNTEFFVKSVEDIEYWSPLTVYSYSDNEDIKEFGRYIRSNFIEIELEGNILSINADLKNYESTIEEFIAVVLPKWTESIIYLYSIYEESDLYQVYQQSDGNFFYTLQEEIEGNYD